MIIFKEEIAKRMQARTAIKAVTDVYPNWKRTIGTNSFVEML